MKPFDLNGLKTYDLDSRPSKVFHEDLGQPLPANATVAEWLDSLPTYHGRVAAVAEAAREAGLEF